MRLLSYVIEAHVIRIIKGEVYYLMLKRSTKEKYPGLWQMVSGAISKNEKAFRAALREIKEETGLSPQRFFAVPKINSFYLPERDHICFVPVFTAIVDSNSSVRLSEEHTEYKWVNKKDAIEMLAWPGQREVVEIIDEYFGTKQSALNFVEIKDIR